MSLYEMKLFRMYHSEHFGGTGFSSYQLNRVFRTIESTHRAQLDFPRSFNAPIGPDFLVATNQTGMFELLLRFFPRSFNETIGPDFLVVTNPTFIFALLREIFPGGSTHQLDRTFSLPLIQPLYSHRYSDFPLGISTHRIGRIFHRIFSSPQTQPSYSPYSIIATIPPFVFTSILGFPPQSSNAPNPSGFSAHQPPMHPSYSH